MYIAMSLHKYDSEPISSEDMQEIDNILSICPKKMVETKTVKKVHPYAYTESENIYCSTYTCPGIYVTTSESENIYCSTYTCPGIYVTTSD